jgi:hypothetical protein
VGKRKIARAKRFGLPHRDYNRRRKDLEPIFKGDLADIESGAIDMDKILSETRILQRTLYRWYRT